MGRCLSNWQAPFPIYCATVGICTTLFGFGTSTTDTSSVIVSASVSSSPNKEILFLLPSKYLRASCSNAQRASTASD